jgi:sugar lactone lactonase YvrE
MAHRVCRLDDGGATTFFAVERRPPSPTEMAFAADGRLFVCTTISRRRDRAFRLTETCCEEIALGEHATNCIFDGRTLYVTARGSAEIHADQRTGTFWQRRKTDAVGLPRLPGRACSSD